MRWKHETCVFRRELLVGTGAKGGRSLSQKETTYSKRKLMVTYLIFHKWLMNARAASFTICIWIDVLTHIWPIVFSSGLVQTSCSSRMPGMRWSMYVLHEVIDKRAGSCLALGVVIFTETSSFIVNIGRGKASRGSCLLSPDSKYIIYDRGAESRLFVLRAVVL